MAQPVRHFNNVQDDEHSDDADDIVGSYLAENDLDFLTAWSSINSNRTYWNPLSHSEIPTVLHRVGISVQITTDFLAL
jgi:hypothetical protein